MDRVETVEIDLAKVVDYKNKLVAIDNNLSLSKKNAIRRKNRVIKNQHKARMSAVFDHLVSAIVEEMK